MTDPVIQIYNEIQSKLSRNEKNKIKKVLTDVNNELNILKEVKQKINKQDVSKVLNKYNVFELINKNMNKVFEDINDRDIKDIAKVFETSENSSKSELYLTLGAIMSLNEHEFSKVYSSDNKKQVGGSIPDTIYILPKKEFFEAFGTNLNNTYQISREDLHRFLLNCKSFYRLNKTHNDFSSNEISWEDWQKVKYDGVMTRLDSYSVQFKNVYGAKYFEIDIPNYGHSNQFHINMRDSNGKAFNSSLYRHYILIDIMDNIQTYLDIRLPGMYGAYKSYIEKESTFTFDKLRTYHDKYIKVKTDCNRVTKNCDILVKELPVLDSELYPSIDEKEREKNYKVYRDESIAEQKRRGKEY